MSSCKKDGECCPQGPPGPRGPRGKEGPTGPTATLHFTHVVARESQVVPAGTDVHFAEAGPTFGIDATNPNAVRITRGGVYAYDYEVRARSSGPGLPLVVELRTTGNVTVPRSQRASLPGVNTGDIEQVTGAGLARFEAGQEVDLINVGPQQITTAPESTAEIVSLRLFSVALDP